MLQEIQYICICRGCVLSFGSCKFARCCSSGGDVSHIISSHVICMIYGLVWQFSIWMRRTSFSSSTITSRKKHRVKSNWNERDLSCLPWNQPFYPRAGKVTHPVQHLTIKYIYLKWSSSDVEAVPWVQLFHIDTVSSSPHSSPRLSVIPTDRTTDYQPAR